MGNRNYKTLSCPFCKSKDLLEVENYSGGSDIIFLCNDCKKTFMIKFKDISESKTLLEE